MILTNFYNRTPQATSKIIIQIFTILSIVDIIWILYFSSAWVQISKEEEEKLKIGGDSACIASYWNSLWFIHGFVYFLAFIELILKGLLLYYLVVDYKGKYSLKSLFNLSYEDLDNKSNETPNDEIKINNNDLSNDIGDFGREIETNSFDENF